MAAGILMGVGALASFGGSLASGAMASKAAQKQAEAQKRATSRYAKALRQQASKMQGGMSQARIRSLQAAGAMQRASEAQQSRTEAARGGRAPSAMLEAELGAAQQMAAVEQQKMLDQLSQQTAERKAATRQQLQGAALQSEAQAQAIDPKAMKKATMAPYVGQAIGNVGSSAFSLGSSMGLPTMKQQFQAGKLTKLQGNVGEAATMLESGKYDLSKLSGPQLKATTQFNLLYSQAMRPTYTSSFPEARDE
jgi:hypothetical protein